MSQSLAPVIALVLASSAQAAPTAVANSVQSAQTPQHQKVRQGSNQIIIAQSLGCAPKPARPEEVKAGMSVHDKFGAAIGTIDVVGPNEGVIKTESGSIRVPLKTFGLCASDLRLGITAREFKKLVLSAQAAK